MELHGASAKLILVSQQMDESSERLDSSTLAHAAPKNERSHFSKVVYDSSNGVAARTTIPLLCTIFLIALLDLPVRGRRRNELALGRESLRIGQVLVGSYAADHAADYYCVPISPDTPRS